MTNAWLIALKNSFPFANAAPHTYVVSCDVRIAALPGRFLPRLEPRLARLFFLSAIHFNQQRQHFPRYSAATKSASPLSGANRQIASITGLSERRSASKPAFGVTRV